MADVFISYARKDRDRIEPLASALERAGYSVWWDHRIAGGAAFAAEIERQLHGSRSVVVAWSVNGVQSDWVIDEAGVAKQAGKMVPIRLDATPPPIGFRQAQEIDFSHWRGATDDAAWAGLIRAIDRYLRRGGDLTSSDLVEERAQSRYMDTIAVLPLDNLSGDGSQQFFVDGMHEALIADLSRVKSLKVISRTSTKRYANSNKSVREIGAELGVSKLIEGSVIRAENNVRISVQLIDARSDTHLWGKSFDRDLTNILELQREVAHAIVDNVSVVLTPAEATRLAAAGDVDADAYDAYLRGMFHWYKLSPEDCQAALEFFDAALASDPDYAPAHAGIAMIWAAIQQMGSASPAVAAPRIKQSVDRALHLDPGLFQAHLANAMYLTWSAWAWSDAENAFRQTIELNPNFPDGHAYYSHYLSILGRYAEAEREIDHALRLDPFNPLLGSLYGVCLNMWGRSEEAVDRHRQALAAAPGHWLPWQTIRLALASLGRDEEAFEATVKLHDLLGHAEVVAALRAGLEANDLRRGYADASVALAKRADREYIPHSTLAWMFDHAGDVETAADWIERGWLARDAEIPYLTNGSFVSQEVLAMPKVEAVLEALGIPRVDPHSIK